LDWQSVPFRSTIYGLAGKCSAIRGGGPIVKRFDRWRDLLRQRQNAGNAHNTWERVQGDTLHAHDSTQASKLEQLNEVRGGREIPLISLWSNTGPAKDTVIACPTEQAAASQTFEAPRNFRFILETWE
jgi:hypothetical protein